MKRSLRPLGLAFLLIGGSLAAFPAYFVVRAKFFPPTFDVASIRDDRRFQDAALLERAWQMPIAAAYKRDFTYQSNPSVCGPSSLANAQHSLGLPASEDAVLE